MPTNVGDLFSESRQRQLASRPRIVLVDDDLAIVSLLCQIFDDEDWVVIPCPHGYEALAMIKAGRPDVVLLDIRLETRDGGWQILRQIRRSEWGETLPVIVCSSAHTFDDWPADVDRTLTHVLTKPFELDDLLDIASLCLHEHGSRPAVLK